MREVKYLESLEKFGINLGLDRIKLLLGGLNNPQPKFKSIHVAGTNGKGSTCAMIASILQEAGYKVGLYTSPHLFDYTERIKINGKDISKQDFAMGLRQVKRISAGLRKPRRSVAGFRPTIFEVLTAMAFDHFAKQKVDYAVVEVGMGGRLDATNVLTPLASVVTNIDYEHTAVLGKTLAKIAREKGGIIKPGVPVVTAETKGEPIEELKKISNKNRSLLVQVGRKPLDSAYGLARGKPNTGTLIGKHQQTNAACAVAAIRLAGIKVSRRDIARGIKNVRWPGRFQIISRKPLVIIDGAHNPAGARVLRVTIQDRFPGKKFTLLFGCQKDKDARLMLKELKPITARIIVTHSSHKDAADRGSLSIKQGIKQWGRKGPLLIAGSLYLIADVLDALTAIGLTPFFSRSKIRT